MSDKIEIGDVLKVVSLGSPHSFMGDIVILKRFKNYGANSTGLYCVKSIKTKKIYSMKNKRFKYVGTSNPNNNIIIKL